jgi:hypothetical protein
MKLKFYFLCMAFLCSASITIAQSGQNTLTVGDPQLWNTYAGTIDQATITLQPKGIYTECTFLISYSSKSTPLIKSTDTSEVLHYFTLPKNAAIIDSWLWVNDVPERANLIDRWTATQIYEGIVKRRKDPSLLVKNSETQYEFRIFPLQGGNFRKVKLTFLLTNTFTGGKVTTQIPTNLLWNSKIALKNTKIQIINPLDWKLPTINGIILDKKTDATLGEYMEGTIPSITNGTYHNLSFETPVKNGVFIAKDANAEEGSYQFVLQPDKFLNIQPVPKKYLFVMDFSTSNSYTTASSILTSLENNLTSRLQETDSFTVAYASLKTKFTSDKWVSASPANILAAISKLKSATFLGNVPTTILDGIDFVKKSGGANNIFWIAAATPFDLGQSNLIIEEFKSSGKTPPIMILDYGDKGQYSAYYGNKYYYGNAYLYSNISSLSDGAFETAFNYQSQATIFTKLFSAMLSSSAEEMDLSTTLTDGYCHSKFNLSANNTTTFTPKEPIVQVGKFSGKFPFEMQLAGKIDGKFYKQKLIINENDIVTIDSTTRQYWAEHYLINKEYQSNLSNKDIADLIKFSMKNRVLCRYTAFLALEPKIADPKSPNGGGGGLAADKNLNDINLVATAYPNPFRDDIKIDVEYDENSSESVEIEIYNMASQKLYTSSTSLNEGFASFSWTAENVPAGIYFAKIKIGKLQKVIKIVKVE